MKTIFSLLMALMIALSIEITQCESSPTLVDIYSSIVVNTNLMEEFVIPVPDKDHKEHYNAVLGYIVELYDVKKELESINSTHFANRTEGLKMLLNQITIDACDWIKANFKLTEKNFTCPEALESLKNKLNLHRQLKDTREILQNDSSIC